LNKHPQIYLDNFKHKRIDSVWNPNYTEM